jgi:hypothetical protein
LFGGGRKDFFTAGSGAASMSGGKGSADTFVGGVGPGTTDAAGAKSAVFLSGATNHGGTHAIEHDDSARAVGGSMALNLGDGTTVTLRNFTGLNAKDIG